METLESFIEERIRAAIYLYRSDQLRHLLRGEETVGGALALLLEEELKTQRESTEPRRVRQKEARRARRAGLPSPHPTKRITGYIGVKISHGRFEASAKVDGKYKGLGIFDTAREAALAYDAFVSANFPTRNTNKKEGLL